MAARLGSALFRRSIGNAWPTLEPVWSSPWAFLGCAVAAIALLVASVAPIKDAERECGLAADVAQQVGGGPFYRNLAGEMVGEQTGDELWQVHCSAVFRRRGLEILPPSALLSSPTRAGTRFGGPYFFDREHASIDAIPFGRSDDRVVRASVELRGDRWVIVRKSGRLAIWPPVY